MINYLKLYDHKALDEVTLRQLGRINIVCGRNSSGKTTLLEAMCDLNKTGVGKKVDSVEWLESLFESEAARFTNPRPNNSKEWFKKYIQEIVDSEEVWYESEKKRIVEHINSSQKQHPVLARHKEGLFNFGPLLKTFFSKEKDYYSPILIPPKRRLDFRSGIDLNKAIEPDGTGLLNKLFYLKNQDLESDSYRTFKKIYDTFSYITNSKFNIVPNTQNSIELFYQTNGDWILSDACGLGLSDVLIIVTLLNVLENNVILIEEPENHLHADFQKRLLSYLTSIKGKQFVISTHSSTFLNTDIIDKIFYCQINEKLSVSDQTSKSEIISSLGYSFTENLVADLIILLEGPTDIPVIKEMLKWFGIDSHHNIKYWPLGGDIMASLDLSVFAERNNVYALIDSDPGSSVQRTRFKRNCNTNQIYCKRLKRYSIENYFSIEAIQKTFPQQIPAKVTQLEDSKSVDEQIGFKRKNKTIKTKNYSIVKEMSLEDIKGTDLEQFLKDVKKFFK